VRQHVGSKYVEHSASVRFLFGGIAEQPPAQIVVNDQHFDDDVSDLFAATDFDHWMDNLRRVEAYDWELPPEVFKGSDMVSACKLRQAIGGR
jgi:hypothetical protein